MNNNIFKTYTIEQIIEKGEQIMAFYNTLGEMSEATKQTMLVLEFYPDFFEGGL